MTTSFSSLPIVDLSILSHPEPSNADLQALSQQLHHVFTTTGFAYLANPPLTFSHDDVFSLARQFFHLDMDDKMHLAKQSFAPSNHNTYRGYFPPQPGQTDNLKEGFEIGPPSTISTATTTPHEKFNLAEANVWPQSLPAFRSHLETLHHELQTLSATLLSLLATALHKPSTYFTPYLSPSLSTLRLLHYPPQETSSTALCCTPHTDSGLLTLLHQDPTGGLEVLNASGTWVPAPYVPNSIVVNLGDLMARLSGQRYVATMHRVRASAGGSQGGRLSVPFFFEPGEACAIEVESGEEVLYGEHVRAKMGTWVEYLDEKTEGVKVEVVEAY